MKKRLIFLAKLLVFLTVVGFVVWQVQRQWGVIANAKLAINWAFAPVAMLGFIGVMTTSGLVWVWMARQMGDRNKVLPLMGAYVFSQMGKYAPGKVLLLLMRIERAGRVGMDARVVTLSTLLENAMYMVSGALVAAVSIGIFARNNPILLLVMLLAAIAILCACHPRIFYFLVDKGLQKFKRPPVDAAHRLSVGKLLIAVLMFLPCWLFGGLALWGSIRCFSDPIGLADALILPGAFAASVIGGMAVGISPGGLGPREAILTLLLGAILPNQAAVLLSVAFQRLFQLSVEGTLGLLGATLTARRKTNTPPPEENVPPSPLTADRASP